MKLICTQEKFKKAIYNSERVVSKQTTLPILNNILFETDSGGLKLSATNLEIGVQVKIGAKVEKEGKITIPAKLISNFSANLPHGENVSLELVDQNLKIKSGSTQVSIKGLPASDFPLIPKKNSEYLLEIPSQKLKDVLSCIMVSVSHNEARPELAGVDVIFKADEIYFASTDSFRLGEYILKLDEKNILNKENYSIFLDKKGEVIIPANTFTELNRIISNDPEGMVKIAIEEGQIFFEISGTRIVSRLVNGKYPEYRNIMPESYKTNIIGEKSVIQNALKVASIFSNSKSNETTLKIDADGKKVIISSASVETGDNSTELDFAIQGISQEIVFNLKYLLDGINIISTSKIAILANTETSPVAIQAVDEKSGEIIKDYTYIVMPIKN